MNFLAQPLLSVLLLTAGPARQTRQNFGRSSNISIVLYNMSDIKLPVKHTLPYMYASREIQTSEFPILFVTQPIGL